ncbi:WYL domain-containing protein [Dyadobacter sp. 676]|uniref:WYL domain-containing protein n=1 Tax=Dyadobacter sp. 676 TaxID=3088362 RepID=A0AAU8FL81_9BACT
MKGLEHIESIRQAIISKTAMCFTYQCFKARAASTFCFSPYLLKEYRNRWFVLGESHRQQEQILTLALDRILHLTEEPAEVYRENHRIDLVTHYDDVIGVTKTPGRKSTVVTFRIDHANAPYVITKPLQNALAVTNTVRFWIKQKIWGGD